MAASSLWRNARPLIGGRAVSAIIGFALPVVLARALDATSYGTYKQVYLIANLALYSLQLGLAQSLFYFVPRATNDNDRQTYIGQTQTMLSIVGLIGFIGLAGCAPFIAEKFSNRQLHDLGTPIALLAGLLIAAAPFEIAMTSRGRPLASAVVLVTTDLVRVTAMLAALALGFGLRGLVWAAALSAAARWILSLVCCGGFGHFALTGDFVKKQLVYSLPFGCAILLLNQQIQLHQIFVSTHTTPAAFALYSIGCMQIPIVSLLFTPVSETLQVRLAALERLGETHKAGAAFSEAVNHLALIFLPLCALLIATARPGLHLLYGGRYDDASAILRIAVLSVAVASLPADGVLKARAKTGTLLAIYAVKLAVTWPLLAAGYHLFGLEGVIGAHVIVELLTKFGQLALISMDLRIPMIELLGGGALIYSLTLAVTVGVFASLTTMIIHRPIWDCVVAGGVAVSIVWGEMWRRKRRAVSIDSVAKAA